MKKRSALSVFRRSAPSAPATIVVSPSGGGRGRRIARRAGGIARAVGRRGGRVAKEHAVPAMGMAIGGAIAGALDAKGLFNKLPAFGGSRALTLAAAGYAATRFSKNKTIRLAGLAAIAVGAFDAVKSHMISAAPMAAPKTASVKGTEGHDDPSGHEGDGGPF